MKTNTLNVFRGPVPDPAFVRGVRGGGNRTTSGPHRTAGGPRQATAAQETSRSSTTRGLGEVARIPVGRQPHDVAFSPASRTLQIGHEHELLLIVIDVGTRRQTRTLPTGRRGTTSPSRLMAPSRWFAVTSRPYAPGDPGVGVLDLASGHRLTPIDTGADSHDVTLSPGGQVARVTTSGFVDGP